MVYHRHFTAAKWQTLIYLLKVTGKSFDLLKPESYLSRLEDIARHAA